MIGTYTEKIIPLHRSRVYDDGTLELKGCLPIQVFNFKSTVLMQELALSAVVELDPIAFHWWFFVDDNDLVIVRPRDLRPSYDLQVWECWDA